jgi:hypothetical protein
MARRERQLRARLALPQGLIERATKAGCPILSRSLRKGGKPRASTSEQVSLLRPGKPPTPSHSRSSRP